MNGDGFDDKEDDNRGDAGEAEAIQKHKRVTAAPPLPTIDQNESDADDRQADCKGGEETESLSRKDIAVQKSFLPASQR